MLAACGGGGGGDAASDESTGGDTEATEPEQEQEQASEDAPAAEAVVLKFNSVKGAQDKMYGYWEEFFKRVEDASGGTLKVECYPSEALGKAADMVEATAKGADVLQDVDGTQVADYNPDMSVFMAPYLIQTPDQIEKLWKSDVGQEMCAKLAEKGLHVVTIVYFGTRHLISNTEVKSREDTSGMKIRCAPTKMWNATVEVLGGNPTNTAWSEAYNALSQGVADGAESPLSLLYSSKLYEPCKNISLTGHLVAHTVIVMSEDVYQGLPPEAQKAIDEVGAAYPPLAIEEVTTEEDSFKALLEENGVTFNEVDKAGFIEAAKSIPEQFPEWSDGLYDRVQEAIK
jgi:tripartite ATP-independent transporter DctP family solute receptor